MTLAALVLAACGDDADPVRVDGGNAGRVDGASRSPDAMREPPTTFSVMSASLTSGDSQTYEEVEGPYQGPGIRLFRGLAPDIVLVQELNFRSSTPEEIAGFVAAVLGPEFTYHRGTGLIPNGIISRFPFCADRSPSAGEWDDPEIADRSFVWACLDVPGDTDLWAVSVHFKASDGDEERARRLVEADALVAAVDQNVPAGDLLVIGGDLNTYDRADDDGDPPEPCLVGGVDGQGITRAGLDQIVVLGGQWPVDQAGDSDTNAARVAPFDWVLADPDLEARAEALVIGEEAFPSGLVFDSRLYTPLTDVAPITAADSGAPGMQHMPVMRAFRAP